MDVSTLPTGLAAAPKAGVVKPVARASGFPACQRTSPPFLAAESSDCTIYSHTPAVQLLKNMIGACLCKQSLGQGQMPNC